MYESRICKNLVKWNNERPKNLPKLVWAPYSEYKIANRTPLSVKLDSNLCFCSGHTDLFHGGVIVTFRIKLTMCEAYVTGTKSRHATERESLRLNCSNCEENCDLELIFLEDWNIESGFAKSTMNERNIEPFPVKTFVMMYKKRTLFFIDITMNRVPCFDVLTFWKIFIILKMPEMILASYFNKSKWILHKIYILLKIYFSFKILRGSVLLPGTSPFCFFSIHTRKWVLLFLWNDCE